MFTAKIIASLAFGVFAATSNIVYAQLDKTTDRSSVVAIPPSGFIHRPEVQAAIKAGNEQRLRLVEQARDLVRQGKLAEAIKQYQAVSSFVIDLPNAPDGYSQLRLPMSEREEFADVIERNGQLDGAIVIFRELIYAPEIVTSFPRIREEQRTNKTLFADTVTTLALEKNTQIWATNNSNLLARYVQLLITKGEYDEALFVYNKAIDTFLPSNQSKGLIESLKSTNNNFDATRFRSAALVLLARARISDDAHFGYNDVMKVPAWQVAKADVSRAIRIKSDFAPAYLLAAQIDIDFDSEHCFARKEAIRSNLDKAEQFARSETLRDNIKRMRAYVD